MIIQSALFVFFFASLSLAFSPSPLKGHEVSISPRVSPNYRKAVTDAAFGTNQTKQSSDDRDSDDSAMLTPKPKFSKAKWKKKRFLLVQDVKNLIRQNSPNAPKKAEEMVRRMLTLYEKSGGDREFRPTLQSYNLWIHALAKSRWDNAGQLAEDVMEEMRASQIWPDVITYTSVMDAHAQSQNPERAEGALFRLLEDALSDEVALSSITCDTILNAWAQQGTVAGAERAQIILFRLEEWQRNDIRPTKISYATVMNAWAKVGSMEAAEQAEALLKRMLKMNMVKPDTVVFNAAINAWATSKNEEAGKRAQVILSQMKDLAENEKLDTLPDIVSYNTVLSAWSHSGDENAAPQTERIVQEMQKAMAESDEAPIPNTVSYNTILNAWAKSTLPGAAPRAQKVLDYMIKSGNANISPDVISFSSVLDAWAKSKEEKKSTKCRDLLDQLLELYKSTNRKELRPTHYTYNSVLNACAFSAMGTTMEEQREALQIAVSTFSSMWKSDTSPETIKPDTVSYGNMLKCLANLMPRGNIRSTMALQIFDKCTVDGMVGALVWNEVRRAVPSMELAKAYRLKGPVGNLKVRDLPKKWSTSNRYDRKAPQPRRKDDEKHTPVQPRVTIVEQSFQSGKDI